MVIFQGIFFRLGMDTPQIILLLFQFQRIIKIDKKRKTQAGVFLIPDNSLFILKITIPLFEGVISRQGIINDGVVAAQWQDESKLLYLQQFGILFRIKPFASRGPMKSY